MHIQLALLLELLVTIRIDCLRTCRLISVNSTMHSSFEDLVTIRTGERLFTSVNLNMHFQMTALFELFVTITTNRFSPVNFTMTVQTAILFILFSTSCHNQDRRTGHSDASISRKSCWVSIRQLSIHGNVGTSFWWPDVFPCCIPISAGKASNNNNTQLVMWRNITVNEILSNMKELNL